MRRKILSVLCVLFVSGVLLFAKPVNIGECQVVAKSKIVELNKIDYHISDREKVKVRGEFSYMIFHLRPQGYIITSSDTDLPPIFAYSFVNNFEKSNKNPMKTMLEADLKLRMKNLTKIPNSLIESRNEKWNNLFKSKDYRFEQWPPDGSTTTGGWLESHWNQTYPYNMYCPKDPVTEIRSYAGCPAVAVAQIINYYKNIYEISFNDDDDYYHSYAGRNFWIDDDYEEHDFASFPQLNTYLDTLNYNYLYDYPITNQGKGTLIFATGVAATQVYTSQVSGTFYDSQVLDAYVKFNYSNTEMLLPNVPNFYETVSDEIKSAHPVHLSVVTEANDAGHQIVIDGYNTDDFYHLNFGWGGTSDSWYNIPDDIPYGLTVISCVFVNINPPMLPLGLVLGNIQLDIPPADENLQIEITAENSRGVYFVNVTPNESGSAEYVLSLPLGRYEVSVSYQGYETIISGDVFIEANGMEFLDYELSYMQTPQNLSAILEQNQVTLNWDFDITRNFEYFNIYRKIDDDFTVINTTEENYYMDIVEASFGDTIYYHITAKYAQTNESSSSNVVSVIYNVDASINELSQSKFKLCNYPNPFNPITNIKFYIAESNSNVSVEIFNIKGQKVISLLKDNNLQADTHTLIWDGKNENAIPVSSGVYFCRLKSNDHDEIKKIVMMK